MLKIKDTVLKIGILTGALGVISSSYAVQMPLKYDFTVTNKVTYEVATYDYTPGVVKTNCDPESPSGAGYRQRIEITGSGSGNSSVKGEIDAAKDIASSSLCIVVTYINTTGSVTDTYYGPYAVNQTCTINYGNSNYPDTAAFELNSSNLYMRAKIGGYANTGEGNIENCIAQTNLANERMHVVSISPLKKTNGQYDQVHNPVVTIYEKDEPGCRGKRGPEIYTNRLLPMSSAGLEGDANRNLHFGIPANKPFCLDVRYGDAGGEIKAGAFSVNTEDACVLTPRIDDNNNLYFQWDDASGACFTGEGVDW